MNSTLADPDLAKAYANIGRFFVAFSHMEAAVDRMVLGIYGLRDKVAGPAIAAELPFQKKLDVIKAAIPTAKRGRVLMTEEWREAAEATRKSAERLNTHRVRLAHDYLVALPNGAVKVHKPDAATIRGSGGNEWSAETLRKHSEDMLQVARDLTRMGSEVGFGLYAEGTVVTVTGQPVALTVSRPSTDG